MKIAQTLLLLDDPVPRAAALQMAIDQLLLRHATLPILHTYQWKHQCVTIGYFELWESAALTFPNLEITRRWTGGGAVEHGEDWPYSLIIPHNHPFATVRPGESYRKIHALLAGLLSLDSPHFSLAAEDSPKLSSACFENPVQHDILIRGEKIAGAGQRRNKLGLLHQGSVQLPRSLHPTPLSLAHNLAQTVAPMSLPPEILQEAEQLAAERYMNPAWVRAR